MFEHSVKVPRLYKAAGQALKKTRTEGVGLQSLVAALDSRRINTNALYGLLVETIKRETQLSNFFAEIKLFDAEPRLDPWLARVLFTELILAKKSLTGDSKPVQTVKKYYETHKDLLDSLKTEPDEFEIKKAIKPRYVRINTIYLSAADAVRGFQDDGWNLVRCTSGSYDDFLRQVENLGESDFMPDYHVKVVFAFPPKTSFSKCTSYNNGEIFLQDKATCLAGHLLAPTPGSTVLDMCAAPGMKTTHLAAIMKNEGTIYSIEQDKQRYDVLCQFVESSGATCVKVLNRDAATITKIDCPNVDYILLDPSCSGSGISRIENNDAKQDLQSGRLKKLSAFQGKLLRHVLNEFRTAKRIVYSTCSLYPQENEEVVRDVLHNHKGKYKLVSAKERLNNNWNNTGDLIYTGIGEKCLYARPDSDYTSGFFIAIFERPDEPDVTNDEQTANEITKANPTTNGIDVSNKNLKSTAVDESSDGMEIVKKKKKKDKDSIIEQENHTVLNNDASVGDASEHVKKKKKSKKAKVDEENIVNDSIENNVMLVDDKILEEFPKKHKKKKKDKVQNNETNIEIVNDINESVKKEKKSKKRRHDVDHENNTEDPDVKNSEAFDENIKKKKKKKSKIGT